jgi:hypothetical protein
MKMKQNCTAFAFYFKYLKQLITRNKVSLLYNVYTVQYALLISRVALSMFSVQPHRGLLLSINPLKPKLV